MARTRPVKVVPAVLTSLLLLVFSLIVPELVQGTTGHELVSNHVFDELRFVA